MPSWNRVTAPYRYKAKGGGTAAWLREPCNMGNYRQQNQAFFRGETPTPEITAHPFTRSVKYGVGLYVEQQISENRRVHARFGWTEGQPESFAYTEVDQTFAVGGDYSFKAFNRPNDKLGLTFVSNVIKKDHQT